MELIPDPANSSVERNDISRAVREFDKRMAEIQAEAERKSFELREKFIDMFKVEEDTPSSSVHDQGESKNLSSKAKSVEWYGADRFDLRIKAEEREQDSKEKLDTKRQSYELQKKVIDIFEMDDTSSSGVHHQSESKSSSSETRSTELYCSDLRDSKVEPETRRQDLETKLGAEYQRSKLQEKFIDIFKVDDTPSSGSRDQSKSKNLSSKTKFAELPCSDRSDSNIKAEERKQDTEKKLDTTPRYYHLGEKRETLKSRKKSTSRKEERDSGESLKHCEPTTYNAQCCNDRKPGLPKSEKDSYSFCKSHNEGHKRPSSQTRPRSRDQRDQKSPRQTGSFTADEEPLPRKCSSGLDDSVSVVCGSEKKSCAGQSQGHSGNECERTTKSRIESVVNEKRDTSDEALESGEPDHNAPKGGKLKKGLCESHSKRRQRSSSYANGDQKNPTCRESSYNGGEEQPPNNRRSDDSTRRLRVGAHLSRKDRHLKNLSERETEGTNKKMEKLGAKRPTEPPVPDVIDSSTPLSGSISKQKDVSDSDGKTRITTRGKSNESKSKEAPNMDSLDAMEAFLKTLRDAKDEKTIHGVETQDHQRKMERRVANVDCPVQSKVSKKKETTADSGEPIPTKKSAGKKSTGDRTSDESHEEELVSYQQMKRRKPRGEATDDCRMTTMTEVPKLKLSGSRSLENQTPLDVEDRKPDATSTSSAKHRRPDVLQSSKSSKRKRTETPEIVPTEDLDVDDIMEMLKKELILLSRNASTKSEIEPTLYELLFGDEAKCWVSKKKRFHHKAQRREESFTKSRKKRDQLEKSRANSRPNLQELETFLSELRENRQVKCTKDPQPNLKRQSLRRDSTFSDGPRAKRKAKLMACVAATAKASAKEAKFLEALRKAKGKYEKEKAEIIQKLKAGNEAAIFSAPLTRRHGEKESRSRSRSIAELGHEVKPTDAISEGDNSANVEERGSRQTFGISFTFKTCSKAPNSDLYTPTSNNLLSTIKMQTFLNSVRAKKMGKKRNQKLH